MASFYSPYTRQIPVGSYPFELGCDDANANLLGQFQYEDLGWKARELEHATCRSKKEAPGGPKASHGIRSTL